MEKKKRRLLLLGSLVALLLLAFLVISRVDVATDLIARKASAVVEEMTGLHLTLGDVRGNPVAGYSFHDLSLRKGEGEPLLAAEKIGASVAFGSLLSGSPALDEIVVEGVRGDMGRLLSALPPSEGPSPLEAMLEQIRREGRLDVPLKRLGLKDVVVTTPAGDVAVASARTTFGGDAIASDLDFAFRGLPVKGDLKLDFSGKALAVKDLDLAVGKGRVTAEGRIDPELDGTAELKDFDVAELLKLWPEMADRGFAGTFGTTVKAAGDWRSPRLEGELTFDGGRVAAIPFDVARTSWSYDVKSLSLPDVKARLAGIPLAGKMNFGFSQLPPDLDISVFARDVAVTALAESFPALKGATGTIEAVTVNLGGRSDAVRGKAFVRAPRFAYEGQTVEAVSAELAFGADGRAKLTGGASWMGAPVQAEGDVVYSPEIRFDLSVRAAEVDLARLGVLQEGFRELQPQGKAGVILRLRGKPSEYAVTGTAEAARARLKGELFEDTRAEFGYAPSGLDLKSFQSRWGQAALSGSGRVTGIAEGKPRLSLSGRVQNLDLASLSAFAPALADRKPSGRVSLDWKAEGDAAAPTVTVSAASDRLALAPVGAEGVIASGSFNPGGKTLLAGPFRLAARKISAAGAVFEEARASLLMEGPLVRLSDVAARIGGGSLTASGTIDTAKAPQALEMKGEMKGVDLAGALAKGLVPVDLGGKVDASFALTGTTEAPAFSVQASSPALTVAGLAVDQVKVDVAGTPAAVSVSRAEAVVGGAPFTATADVSLGDELKATFAASASAVDLTMVTARLPQAADLALAGKADFSLSGSYGGGVLAGEGDLSSTALRVRGISVENLKVPLALDKDALRVDAATARAAGGEVKAWASLALERMTWTAEASVKGSDLKTVTGALSEGKGSLSGPADLTFKGNGNLRYGTILGDGVLSVGEGELEGFKSAEMLAKLHGSPRFRYRSLLANYTVDSSGLQLLPGTRALALPGDALYRTLETEGAVGFDKKLDLNVRGNVNVQALNAVLGGVEGLLTSGGQTPEALLKGLLQGVTGGGSQQDFRNVTFHLGGTTDSLKVSNLKIEQPLQQQGEPPAQGKEIQAAPEKTQPTDPAQILQQEVLKKIFGN